MTEGHSLKVNERGTRTYRHVDYRGSASPGTSCDDNRAPATNPEGRLLILDGDPLTRRTLHGLLYSLGFDVAEARTGEEAIALCHVVPCEAVLFDSDASAGRGTDICRSLRRMLPRAALFVLSVHGDHARRIEALEAGADDYVIKPFHMRELTARLRSALRCIRACSVRRDDPISIGDIQLDPARRLLFKAGNPIDVTSKELDLLHYLMRHAGLPIGRSRLLAAVWGPEYSDQLEYLRNVVRHLRKKLEDDPARPKYLVTDCCIGYRFSDHATAN